MRCVGHRLATADRRTLDASGRDCLADVEDDYALCFDWDFVPGWIIDHVDWSSPMMPAILTRGGGKDAGAAAEWPSAEQELLP